MLENVNYMYEQYVHQSVRTFTTGVPGMPQYIICKSKHLLYTDWFRQLIKDENLIGHIKIADQNNGKNKCAKLMV